MGGSTGIGLAIAEALAGAGCRVVSASRRPAAQVPQGVEARLCDAGDRAAVQGLFAEVEQRIGPVEILVYAAGINVPRRSFAEIDPADFDRILAVGATGTFNCFHAVLPGMRARKSGLILNIVSLAGLRTYALSGVSYCAAKFAQHAIGAFTNMEAAPEGVRITNIYPGDTDTPLLEQRPAPPSAEQRALMLQPEDVAVLALTIARLPARAAVPQILIAPTVTAFA
jgi:NAD(P)-dependent dehydrogenase (short-subunit alcohol dehydrogenase family)